VAVAVAVAELLPKFKRKASLLARKSLRAARSLPVPLNLREKKPEAKRKPRSNKDHLTNNKKSAK
jgi:hypothetical protein